MTNKNMKPGSFEYIMPAKMATALLKQAPANIKPQDYLIQYVNEQFGLLYWCTKVTIS